MYRQTGKFEWMKIYLKQDVMEIQTIIILRSQGVKESKEKMFRWRNNSLPPLLLPYNKIAVG